MAFRCSSMPSLCEELPQPSGWKGKGQFVMYLAISLLYDLLWVGATEVTACIMLKLIPYGPDI